MSGFELTARIVETLAWPVAIVVLLIGFRRSLTRLLSRTTEAAVNFGEFGGQWKGAATTASTELSTRHNLELRIGSAAAKPVSARLYALSATSPADAVHQAYETIESTLRERLAAANMDVPPEATGPTELVRVAVEHGIVSPATVRAVDGVAIMRNLALHDPRRVTPDRAREFLALADAGIFAINGDT